MTSCQLVSKTPLVLTLLLLLPLGNEAAVPLRCFEPVKCQDAILLYVTRSTSLSRCSRLCAEYEECEAYVFDTEGDDDMCSLYKNCTSTVPCGTCTYGSVVCPLTQCFSFNTACRSSSATIIGGMEDIGSIEDCHKACKDHESNECSYFEFLDEEDKPSVCTLLRSCRNYYEEQNVVTGRAHCSMDAYNCFRPYRCVGQEIRSSVTRISDCFEMCVSNDNCLWFVHYDDICSLLTDCQKRIECEDCDLTNRNCPSPDFKEK